MNWIVALSTMSALSVICLFGGLAFTRRDKKLSERLEVYLATGDPQHTITLKELELSKPFSQRVLIPIAQRVARLFLWLLPQNLMNSMRHRLIMAGNPSGMRVNDFVGIKGLIMALVVALALLGAYLTHYPVTLMNGLMLVLVGFCSFSLPDFWLSRRIAQRQLAITNALPDALDLLVIANEAGLSFESSLQEIISKWNNELAGEFSHVLSDMRMGQSRRDALNALADRTGVVDVTSFVSAINQAETMGVSIGRVLTVQSEELRVKRRQRAQERANQAPVKMMFPLVFLIFPSIFAVLLGPAVPQILRTFSGL
jgi:tight adherence protein C